MSDSLDITDNATLQWVQGELRLASVFDARMIRLFAAIERTGSITQAAKDVGLSYKGAWQMVERANNLSPKLLVDTATGGHKGGGTFLTPEGLSFLRLFGRLEEKHRAFLAELNRELAEDPDTLFLLRRLIMKASSRNQFYGKITAISGGDLNTEVAISLKGGQEIIATLDEESVTALGLNVGSNVVALIKAPDIVVVTDFGGYRLSARNQLHGIVSRLQRGAVMSEVVIELPAGDSIAASITNKSCTTLQLKTGMPAAAVFKSNAVMLSVVQG